MQVKLSAPFNLGQLLPLLLLFSLHSDLEAQTISMGLGTRRPLNSDFYGYDMSTTVRGGVSCVSPDLISHLPSLKAKFLRYPAGSSANWWNWHEGWYVNSPYLPEWDVNLTKVPNKLEDFKNLLNCSGAVSIFDLNMLTSNVRDQIAMLKHADSIGIPVKYIELGNEYYLEGDGADDTALILIKYPTAASYRDTANIWIDSLRKYFPVAKIAAQGVFEKDYQPRKTSWNGDVLPLLHNEDAITFHYYFSSKGGATSESDSEKMAVSMDDIPDWFYQPYKAWAILRDKSLPDVPAGKEVWITEYNFSDQTRPVHGTWASGLYTALHGMQLLQDDRIVHIGLHGVDGQAVFGAFFYDDHGYNFGMQTGSNYIGPPNPPVTTPWGLNAYGHTMTMVGNAVDGKTFASKIDFDPNPQLSAIENGATFYYDGLFGFLFNDSVKSQAVILNLTGADQLVRTNFLFPHGGSYEMRTAANGVLGLVATAADVIISTKPVLPVTLVLKPYSITRISANSIPAPPPVASITVNGSTTFCSGDSVQLSAGTGYYSYEWSTGEITQKIWVKNTGNYWLHAYAVHGGYYAADTASITVNPLPKTPVISSAGKKNFCAGGSVELKLASNYSETNFTCYWPLTGSTGSSITANTSGNYTVIVTNQSGCSAVSAPQTVVAYPLPQPVISAPALTSACFDAGITLQATAGYNNYSWSNGAWGQSHLFTASGTYSVTATDINGCKGVSNSVAITIWNPENPVVTSVGSTSYCDGTPGNYLTTIGGYNYNWLKSNVALSGATSQNFTPSLTGNYKVKVTDSHGCSKTSTASVKVTVNKKPLASISTNGILNICNLQTKILTASGGNGFTYKWKKDGYDIGGALSKTYIAVAAGNYSCLLTNSYGCPATSNTITITSACKEGDALTPSGENSWRVYPNPASEKIHFELTLNHENGICNIEIRNLLGELIENDSKAFSDYVISSDLLLDSSLSDGNYFLIVRESGSCYHTQFVIENH